MTEHSHRNLVSSNLMRDLRAATTACESCTIRPFDEALSFALMSPVPTATTVHPPTRAWQEILVKHKQILHHELFQCTSRLLMTSNYIQLVYGLQNSFLPKQPAVKHPLNCGDLRDWVKNAAVVPAQAENSGWPFMSFASWSLTSSGIFRLPELLFSKHQKEDIMKNSNFTFIQHNHSFVFCFFVCPEQNQHFKSPPVIHKHPPQCQLNYREETQKQFLIRVFTCTQKNNRMFLKIVWTVNYRG